MAKKRPKKEYGEFIDDLEDDELAAYIEEAKDGKADAVYDTRYVFYRNHTEIHLFVSSHDALGMVRKMLPWEWEAKMKELGRA